MSEIKVDKVKGRQAPASGPEVTFDSSGNISFAGNISSTGDVTADDVTVNSLLLIRIGILAPQAKIHDIKKSLQTT